jgi:uncharacterized membrane protein
MASTIPNPGSWSVDQINSAGQHLGKMTRSIGSSDEGPQSLPRLRHVDLEDIRFALRKGFEDFAACRSDVAFICLLYPVIGIFLAWAAFQRDLLPLVFPIMSGFALVGPVAAVGLYEMSRKRERGEPTSFADAFRVAGSPGFGAILALGLMLFATFVVWLILADLIWRATLGPETPASIGAFLSAVFTTGAGWSMIIVGMAVGFLFAAVVLAASVISFPMLLDRQCGVPAAVVSSIRLTRQNPRVIFTWGAIVAGSLVIGSIPAFLGLIVVMPVLGHATWHLYRRAVEPAADPELLPPA